jgi:hypothetical protein
LPRDPEVNGAEGIFTDVQGPQLGERLSHCTYGVFHCSRLDDFLHGSLSSISIPLCKDLDDGDGVITVLEEWIDGVRHAELFPMAPMRIRRSGTFSSDSKTGLFLDKANISAESVSFHRWYICQDMVYGKEESKWERSSASVR